MWYFKHRLHGVEKRLSLGQWPDVGLKAAAPGLTRRAI
ncbi:Arm DNA-binding domain-containing protein [Novosphingobium sp. SG720]|nr:Arm DNA-binding domain-containing protein [Novosphingobium sp. SG720]